METTLILFIAAAAVIAERWALIRDYERRLDAWAEWQAKHHGRPRGPMNLRILTPEIAEARKPVVKWLGMYERGVITSVELVHQLAEYALSFKPRDRSVPDTEHGHDPDPSHADL